MEALTAVSLAALTIYDMVKSIDRTTTITTIWLIEKSGDESGRFVRAWQMSGTITSINIAEKTSEKKRPVSSATLVLGSGIGGDAHAGQPIRQVSLLADESIDKMRAAGFTVGPGDFAENMTTCSCL